MSIREIKQAIEEGQSLKQIAQAYGEIATIKIRKIRAQVERNRSFFAEITQVYRIVKIQSMLKNLQVKKSKKTVSILLSSNFRFYGGIDTDVIHFFLENTAKFPTDRIVIGKTGHHYLQVINFNTYNSLDFAGDLPNPEELNKLGWMIKDYQQVLIFYPQLVTLLVQKPIIADITQADILTSLPVSSLREATPKAGEVNHLSPSTFVIFEPELNKILAFFETQIITLLLEQTFFEAELSRTASRILSMDQAQIEAKRFIEGQKQLQAHLQRVEESARLLESLTSIQAIRKVL